MNAHALYQERSTMPTVIDKRGRKLFRGTHPVAPGGELCRFAMRRAGTKTAVYAPTARELVAHVLGAHDYVGQPADDRTVLRAEHAYSVADEVQRRLIERATPHPACVATLTAPKNAPVGVTTWSAPVPLVLVDAVYAPFTATAPPTGRVMWLRAAGEVEYLQSLADVGLIELAIHL